MDADTLRQYLEYYQDLGIKTLYRRQPENIPVPEMAVPNVSAPEPLLNILQDIGDCHRCRLH